MSSMPYAIFRHYPQRMALACEDRHGVWGRLSGCCSAKEWQTAVDTHPSVVLVWWHCRKYDTRNFTAKCRTPLCSHILAQSNNTPSLGHACTTHVSCFCHQFSTRYFTFSNLPRDRSSSPPSTCDRPLSGNAARRSGAPSPRSW